MSVTTTDHVFTKDEVLQNIASATNAVQIVETMDSVDEICDGDVFEAFFDKVTIITSETTHPEGLGLLKEKLVLSNLSHSRGDDDNKIRKVILLQIIVFATNSTKLIEVMLDVDELCDEEVYEKFLEKFKTITSQTTNPEDLKLLKENLVDDYLYNASDEYNDKLKKVVLLQIIATATSNDDLNEIAVVVNNLEDDEVTAAYENKLASLS